MKQLLLIIISIFSLNCFAYDHSYDAYGEDENGNSVEGTIYSNNGEREVAGEITDNSGNYHDFYGQWDGYGQVSGATDDGTELVLNTIN